MWLKYHHKFADGPGEEEWTYIGYTTADGAKEIVLELEQEYEWSEHYRGIDYDVVAAPPTDILEKEIKRYENNIKYNSEHLNYLK